ncbi:MAG TPA: hypothetical protein VLD18_00975, partial [Verrucomicrobiae bacterium]|nr:hypothetical protein [Verrucomicrobiae bacterium]
STRYSRRIIHRDIHSGEPLSAFPATLQYNHPWLLAHGEMTIIVLPELPSRPRILALALPVDIRPSPTEE